jgi:hypothetical protein
MKGLTQQIELIEKDILKVLERKGKAMTERELFENTELKNMARLGWSFALRKLDSKGKIEYAFKSGGWSLKK